MVKQGDFMGLWTKEHAVTLLPALAVMLLIAGVLRGTIGKKSLKVRMIPLQILACILVLIEIGKQVLSLLQGYDLYHLPFHFCSLFIFAMPIMAFYKGKHAEKVRAVTSALCTAVFLMMLIYPNLIYGAGNITNFFTDYLSFHTVLFHNIVMFAFVLIVALGIHTPQPKGEQKATVLFTLCYCVVAATLAQLLKTNFNNFYTCNIPIFETARLAVEAALGSAVAQLFYVCVVTVVDILFVWGSYWFYRLMRRVIVK